MKFIKTTLAALAALTLSFGAAQATELRSADIHPDDYPTVTAVKFMGERLKALSGGKHTIKVFNNGALGSEKDTIEQAKIGALQMVRINIGAMNNICPETVVPTMPFLFRSVEHLHKVLDGPIGEEILKACEKQGFVGLAYYDSGARSMFTAKRPVRTFADMKGLKVRVQQSDLWVSMLEAMGANATPMPMGEVYTGLKTGLIDAAENNYPTYESSRSFEVAKYYTKTEHSMAPEMLLYSKRAWDRLSPEEQGWIRQAAKESVPYMRKQWAEREIKSLATVKAGGAEIIEIDKAAFQAAMKPVYDKFIPDAKLKDLVKRVQDTQ
ncbi:TRAP transporter substrate-binding protein [Paracidovorax valerianellae]|uniref:Tripartite ATP-independent transporter solute receptor, DctP family n=1 Tax=Paracidovorax valerianellae TaxID=187868 RepID=A0A1G6IDP4_9BURK|nr:TRAP transporter substrate-binding protein [Paracidovorax valerianellae]MDA8447946.1 TRAP transporter substrate-binding protein [Paracidovorax valerianellae]SDC04125.1 tripartite ATP-independent transporter solute receptor, DctP family [Paracidovorax valerianellae]